MSTLRFTLLAIALFAAGLHRHLLGQQGLPGHGDARCADEAGRAHPDLRAEREAGPAQGLGELQDLAEATATRSARRSGLRAAAGRRSAYALSPCDATMKKNLVEALRPTPRPGPRWPAASSASAAATTASSTAAAAAFSDAGRHARARGAAVGVREGRHQPRGFPELDPALGDDAGRRPGRSGCRPAPPAGAPKDRGGESDSVPDRRHGARQYRVGDVLLASVG